MWFQNAVALVALWFAASVIAKPCPLPATGAITNSSGAITSSQPSITNSQPSTNLCGNDEHVILDGTPWLVANSMYGASQMEGSSCTHYDKIESSTGGNSAVVWGNRISIQNVESTNNVCKGYANVGLTGNLENTISSINSIPAAYDWTRTNSSPFKGNICFDFILGNTKGDSTSTSAQELMLWLEWDGGQLPIGWDKGTVATIPALFGTSWKLYEDINTSNGMTVVCFFITTSAYIEQ
ncbi:MAG: hypothetical protein Q9170_003331 [Blastenia crenularia]